MKRVALLMFLGIFITFANVNTASAGFIADIKLQHQQNKIEQNARNEVIEILKKQDEYSKKRDLDGLKALYSEDFIDNDGFNKEIYFSLAKTTWESYPDIEYSTEIKNISIHGDYATAETYEKSIATANSESMLIDAIGVLHSESHCLYHLKKTNTKWQITAQQVLSETSSLKFGEARFMDIKLDAPELVSAGQQYTVNLNVDLPENNIIIASISREKLINPPVSPDEKFRTLIESQVLSRNFIANTDNLNECNVATVGITHSEAQDDENIRVYMNGLALIMTRVNVVPKNNFAEIGEDNE